MGLKCISQHSIGLFSNDIDDDTDLTANKIFIDSIRLNQNQYTNVFLSEIDYSVY